MLQPPFWPKISVLLSCLFWNQKLLNKKHNLKSGNSQDKTKGFERKSKTGTKKRENIDEKIAIEYFDVVPFMIQKQRRKKRKERDKNKEPKESKKERKKRIKGETEKEKQKKREAKNG